MKKVMMHIAVVIFLSACGGGGDSTDNFDNETKISSVNNLNQNTSYALQATSLHIDRQAIRTTNQGTFVLAIAYADFDQDGDIDVFMASGDGSENKTPSELYLNDGSDNFILDQNFFNGSPPAQVHPRKALVSDFNGDGKMDIFVVGHGYDKPPFPGEAPYVILSTTDGFKLGAGLDKFIGFHHGGASADIDGDGDIDVLITSMTVPFFLINDGKGNFTQNTNILKGLDNSNFYTTELIDIDNDGYIDILVGGHEQDGFETKILWGDSTRIYDISKSTTLPSVVENGVVLDFDAEDIDNDGDRDIVINRTGDGTGSLKFYEGYYIQVLENMGNKQFLDKTKEKFPMGIKPNETWIDWLHLQNANNDNCVDIIVDDAARDLIWHNDCAGNFQ